VSLFLTPRPPDDQACPDTNSAPALWDSPRQDRLVTAVAPSCHSPRWRRAPPRWAGFCAEATCLGMVAAMVDPPPRMPRARKQRASSGGRCEAWRLGFREGRMVGPKELTAETSRLSMALASGRRRFGCGSSGRGWY
jgi:hypothetical protein